MPTTSGQYEIDYEIRPEVGEQWVIDGVEVSMVLACAWDERGQFVDDMVGWVTWDGASDTFERRVPEAHPEYDNLYCVSCRLREPQGVPTEDEDGNLTYVIRDASGQVSSTSGYAVYDCVFRPLDYEPKADEDILTELERYVSRDVKFSVDSLTIPGQTLRWAHDGEDGDSTFVSPDVSNVIPEPLPKVFPTACVRYTWRLVPGRVVGQTAILPYTNIMDCLGCVNDAAFDAGYGPVGSEREYPAGSLLFTSVEVRRTRNAAAQPVFEVTYDFLYRPNFVSVNPKGHNSLFSRLAGVFIKVFNTVAGKPAIYDEADFGLLFRHSP